MPNNISQEAALVGHMAEKGAPGKDGKTPVKGVDYWTQEDKASIIHDVLESDEYQSVKGLVGTKENPVNFKLLEPGAYVFQGYISITISEETVTNQVPCPKELLLVREVLFYANSTEDELAYEIYAKIGYLFHTDFVESMFGDSINAGAGVLAFIVVPSSVKFLGEWPEDKKNEVITEMETLSTCAAEWVDDWMADDDTDYVTHDELSNAVANLATERYVDNAINNIEFTPGLTEDQVNSLIDAKLGVIENGHY